MDDRARRFIEALAALERGEDEGISELFHDECEVGNAATDRTFRGRDGARAFWREYRQTFGDIASTFRNVIASGDRVALEWTSRGTLRNGDAIAYEGVSVLELGEGGLVLRFRAYFDPTPIAASLRPEPQHAT